jgi:hypothetical protein
MFATEFQFLIGKIKMETNIAASVRAECKNNAKLRDSDRHYPPPNTSPQKSALTKKHPCPFSLSSIITFIVAYHPQ